MDNPKNNHNMAIAQFLADIGAVLQGRQHHPPPPPYQSGETPPPVPNASTQNTTQASNASTQDANATSTGANATATHASNAGAQDAPATNAAPHSPVNALSLEERAARMEAVAKEIRACQQCPLHIKRTHAVPGQGVLDPLVLAIGEAPGAQEDTQGEPFVGKSGQYLDKWLAAINVSRHTNAFIANIVKCRPPDNRDPLPAEVHSCRPFLDTQIELIAPKSILILGRIAAQHLFDTKASLAVLRTTTRQYHNIPVFITYHPSAVLRNPNLRSAVWEDLKKLKAYLGV